MTLLWNRRALANKTFNPFCWKREHQIALVIALFLGDVLGMLIATHFVDSFERRMGYHVFGVFEETGLFLRSLFPLLLDDHRALGPVWSSHCWRIGLHPPALASLKR